MKRKLKVKFNLIVPCEKEIVIHVIIIRLYRRIWYRVNI